MSLQHAYLRALEPWVPPAMRDMYVPPGRPDLLCYGTGYNDWGVQTQQKACAVFAVLADDPALDTTRTGMSRDELRTVALRLLRFNLASHIEGEFHCTDGTPWGHTWISTLGIERMMHGVDLLDAHMTDKDRALLRRVLESEADWLLEHHPVKAGLTTDNVPESNLWNGALLHRVALMYADGPRAAAYREKGTRFLLNAVSVPADAESDKLYDGRPLREWHAGANFFPSLALHHHDYLNVGYMVICLSNAALLHYAYRVRGQQAPAALYQHLKELWQLVRELTFTDGRLARIGGDTRARYCYCQDYAIPAWLLARDWLGDAACGAFEQGWLGHIACECAANGDGSYLGARCGALRAVSPLYFTRLESDRAVALSLGALWHRRLASGSTGVNGGHSRTCFTWHDEYHGAVLHRSATRVASVVWRAAEPPTALCLPPAASSLAEWRQSLSGMIEGEGYVNWQAPETFTVAAYEGGFVTWGRTRVHSHGFVPEGTAPHQELATQELLYAALPDGAGMVVLQYARAAQRRAFLTRCGSLFLPVPNDIFNNCTRRYTTAHGTHTITGVQSQEELIDLRSRWVGIDGRISVCGIDADARLRLYRPGRRQIDLKFHPWRAHVWDGGTLYCDELYGTCRLTPHTADAGALLYDDAWVVYAHDTTETCAAQAAAARRLTAPGAEVSAVVVLGMDRHMYTIVHNRSDAPHEVSCQVPWHSCEVLSGGVQVKTDGQSATFTCPPRSSGVIRCFACTG